MVGIEDEDNKELEGAATNQDSFNNLFENILLTLSQLSTDSTHQQPTGGGNQERRSADRAQYSSAHLFEEESLDSDTDEFLSTDNRMTILPKKKAHKERGEQREHRHHGASAPSQATGYSHSEFGQDAVRMTHSDVDHRPANLSDLMHVHHHASSFQPQVPHSFSEITSSETYRQQLGERATASGASTGRHERIVSRKERSTSQMDLEPGCQAKKRCLSPGFGDKFSTAAKPGTKVPCGLSPHQGLYSSSKTLLPTSSSAQDEATNSDDNNSEDEYYGNITRKTIEDEEKFAKIIEKKGWCIKQMASDGACLFRAVADQIYGDQEMHDEVRINCLDYMSKNEEHFSPYVTEDFSKYIARKRNVHCHGNHLEIQALAEVYNRPIEIYYYDIEPRNVFHGEYKTDYPPIRLSYHGNVHYNSIREPYSATVGIGLGLPEFKPGLAEKQLLSEAMKRSEENQIEEAMLKDKLKDSDWDLMQAQIEGQIAQESYKDWMKSGYGGKRSPKVAKQQQHSPPTRESPKASPPRSPNALLGAPGYSAPAAAAAAIPEPSSARAQPPPTAAAAAAQSFVDYLPPEMSDWDENAILAHALAQSTLHYYETLRCGGAQGHCDSEQPGCSKDS